MADGQGFQVDLPHLDEVTIRMRAFKEFVTNHLTELDNRAAAIGTSWTGPAADAYAQAHRDWAVGATDVREGLDVLEAAAKSAHENYTGAASANLEMFGRKDT
ncbi:WXG100 family type VII secretion target [Nocardia sp. NPDC052566]|uniref:WXG100 family type VII secretion target n=1 Tax=Nocardia sp. NPDC052566 TaxID=3364330 RepID=UPI0037CB8496